MQPGSALSFNEFALGDNWDTSGQVVFFDQALNIVWLLLPYGSLESRVGIHWKSDLNKKMDLGLIRQGDRVGSLAFLRINAQILQFMQDGGVALHVSQFEEIEGPGPPRHLVANFSQESYNEIGRLLKDNELLREILSKRSGEFEVGTLLLTLAYASYVKIRDLSSLDRDAFSRFMGAESLKEFVAQYVGKLVNPPTYQTERGKLPSQIETLLAFVCAGSAES